MNYNKNRIRIIPADVSHAFQIAEIEKQCFSLPWSENAVTDFLTLPTSVCLVAEKDGSIAGYVGMTNILGEGSITNVAVKPEFRRLGIASALISHLIDIAKSKGIDKIMLEVRFSNQSAQNLYEKHGFSVVGTRKNFYSKPTEDALLMDYTFSDRN